MSAGTKYGVCTGVVMAVASLAGPPFLGALMVVIALQSALFVGVVWSRTRLPFISLAGVFAAISAVAGAVLFFRGLDLATVSFPMAFFFVFALLVPIFVAIESRVHPSEWKAWRDHMRGKTLGEVLSGRHIPRLVR